MKATSKNAHKLLASVFNRFDKESEYLKTQCLQVISGMRLKPGRQLMVYHDLLLFIIAHPNAPAMGRLAEKELKRISVFLKPKKNNRATALQNSGLPYCNIITRFSHDHIAWMLQHKEYELSIDSFDEGGSDLGDVLKLCLPSLERELTTYGFNQDELLNELGVSKSQQLKFIINSLAHFDKEALTKDYLFDSLNLNVALCSKTAAFSRSYNRFLRSPVFYHHEMIKHFDALTLINSRIPEAGNLKDEERDFLIKVIKNSLSLTARETDPATFIQTESLRYFELERGIAIAIYGMQANRQLPLESYVGYTLFKNGFPAAYGGAWVFGKRALFGMNIFESFRGGESGYMMCQLLRVYHQVFNVACFEVEPYQFGKDNEDGIKSGAFWFYYRHGFRPNDSALRKLAERERKIMAANKAYHSSHKTLIKFTDSFISLELSQTKQLRVSDYSHKVTTCIGKVFKGNRNMAEQHTLTKFCELTGLNPLKRFTALQEFALLREALEVTNTEKIALMKQMALLKPVDVYGYQKALLAFLAE